MKLSIIVPVYNTEKYIKTCLDSLVKQTFKDYEIIIVNDGSTDNSSEIIENYAKEFNQIKVINQENRGYSGARNSALAVAEGEYIGFVDSDDWVSPEMYEKMIQATQDGAIDIVSCAYYRVYNGNDYQLNSNQYYVEFLNSHKERGSFHGELILDDAMVWNRIYKRELLESNNIKFPEDILFGEDTYFHRCALLATKNICYIPEPLYYYRQGRKGAQTTLSDRRNLSYITNCRKLYDKITNEKDLEYCNHLTLSFCAFGYERIDSQHKNEYFEKFSELINSRNTFKVAFPKGNSSSILFNLRYTVLRILHPIMYFSLKHQNKFLFDCVIQTRILIENLQIFIKNFIK